MDGIPLQNTDDIPSDPMQPSAPQAPPQAPPIVPTPPIPSGSQPSSSAQTSSQSQGPKDEMLVELLEMGFDESTAQIALRRTNCQGAEAAINWILERCNDSDFSDGDGEEMEDDDEDTQTKDGLLEKLKFARTHKMVFVVNSDLKMGLGKSAAQVGHAAIALYRLANNSEEGRAGLQSWSKRGEAKIVVKGNNTEHLMDLFKDAKDKGIIAYIVQDAGYTQIPPGSRTVLGLFGPVEMVDSVSGTLRLL